MATFIDTLATVFTVSGIANTVRAFSQIGDATMRIDRAQRNLANARYWATIFPQGMAAWVKGALNEMGAATEALGKSFIMLGVSALQALVGVTELLVRSVTRAVEAYSALGKEIMDIRSLTGGTGAESAQIAALARGGGVSGSDLARIITRLESNSFTSSGQGAFARLGVPVHYGESGTAILTKTLDALQKLGSSPLATAIQKNLFGGMGGQGVVAIQGLLRLTQDEREELLRLGGAFDTGVLPKLQQLQAGVSTLGLAFLVDFIGPLVTMLLPALNWVIGELTGMLDILKALDTAQPWIKWAVAAIAIGVATSAVAASIIAIVAGAQMLWNIFSAILAVQKLMIAGQVILDILTGNWQLVAAAGIAAAAGVGLYFASQAYAGDAQNTAADKQMKAADDFSSAVDEFKKYSGKNVPGGLSYNDVNMMGRLRFASGIS